MKSVFAAIAALSILTSFAFAEDEVSAERKVRYGVIIEGSQPFFGEALCRAEHDCELVDHKNPNLQLIITSAERGYKGRLYAYCNDRPCVADPETPTIDLRSSGEKHDYRLTVGQNGGREAVIYYRQPIGQIYIAY